MDKAKVGKIILKVAGVIYFVLAVLVVLGGVMLIANSSPELNDELMKLMKNITDEELTLQTLGIIIIISGVFMGFMGWLMRRVAKHPRKSMLLLVLTVLGLIGNIGTMIKNFNGNTIFSAIISAVLVIAVFLVRTDTTPDED